MRCHLTWQFIRKLCLQLLWKANLLTQCCVRCHHTSLWQCSLGGSHDCEVRDMHAGCQPETIHKWLYLFKTNKTLALARSSIEMANTVLLYLLRTEFCQQLKIRKIRFHQKRIRKKQSTRRLSVMLVMMPLMLVTVQQSIYNNIKKLRGIERWLCWDMKWDCWCESLGW